MVNKGHIIFMIRLGLELLLQRLVEEWYVQVKLFPWSNPTVNMLKCTHLNIVVETFKGGLSVSTDNLSKSGPNPNN